VQKSGRMISKGRGKDKRMDRERVRGRLGREGRRVSRGQEAVLYTGAVEIVESRKHQERESEVTLSSTSSTSRARVYRTRYHEPAYIAR
jgi:hypothetical protein